MPKIASVGTATVPFQYDQSIARDFAYNLFSSKRKDVERMIKVFDNAMIEKRQFCYPKDWYDHIHDFVERSESYKENALSLSLSAISNCLDKIGADHTDYDHIIFVSSTGISAPTIDALLINELKLNPHIKRTPIWGLGCVGGAMGLSRAFEYTKTYPSSGVLLVALEICSLAFQKDDYSKSNVVAIAIFADGAAATLVTGDDHRLSPSSKLNLTDTFTTTYYDSLDVMGWDIIETGFKAIFSKDIPTIVRTKVKETVEQFTFKNNLSPENIKHFLLHPGGTKVLNEFETSLGLNNGALNHSRNVLRNFGNMSSPTVLYVIDEFLEEDDYIPGEYGIISALGPGFTSELLLFEIV